VLEVVARGWPRSGYKRGRAPDQQLRPDGIAFGPHCAWYRAGEYRAKRMIAQRIAITAAAHRQLHDAPIAHSALTHAAEDGTNTPMLLARSRHASIRSLWSDTPGPGLKRSPRGWPPPIPPPAGARAETPPDHQ